jgi:hypothetical protein
MNSLVSFSFPGTVDVPGSNGLQLFAASHGNRLSIATTPARHDAQRMPILFSCTPLTNLKMLTSHAVESSAFLYGHKRAERHYREGVSCIGVFQALPSSAFLSWDYASL